MGIFSFPERIMLVYNLKKKKKAFTVEVSDLSSKNMRYLIKFECQINNKYCMGHT